MTYKSNSINILIGIIYCINKSININTIRDINIDNYNRIEMVSLETGIALIIIGIILLVLNRFVPSLPARLLYVIGSIVLVIGIIMVILYFVFGIV
ncbi:MAG: hypothetical protein QOK67_07600 [Nitrososphaeraceae archaeon]|nr:hypothetical protein [Nitrososphaeraceae archaeon]